MELTHKLVRELLDYNTETGALTWRPRERRWFSTDTGWKRWNNRYAGQPAFSYTFSGRRWGCLLNVNYLAHRIAWFHATGKWPGVITFKNGDATDLRLDNMVDKSTSMRPRVRLSPVPPARTRVRLSDAPRGRVRLAA